MCVCVDVISRRNETKPAKLDGRAKSEKFLTLNDFFREKDDVNRRAFEIAIR